MTVCELIKKLNEMPQDKEVVMSPIDFVKCEIESVKLCDDKVSLSDL